MYPQLCSQVLLVLVVSTFSAATACKKAPTYQRLERPAFALDMPQWTVKADEGNAALGKYKVARDDNRAFVEMAWQGGSTVATADELRLYAKSLIDGFKVTPDGKPQLSEGPSDRRLTIIGSIMGGDVWLNVTMVACLKTRMFLTVGAGAGERHTAIELHDRALKSLRCLGDSPADFMMPGGPSSTLHEVGFTKKEEADFVEYQHPDGVAVLASPTGTATLDALVEHPAKTLESIAVGMQIPLRLVTPIVSSLTGLEGATIRTVEAREKGTKAPFVLGVFKCARSGLAYMAVATGPKGTGLSKLESYLRRLGCPQAQRVRRQP